MNLEEADEALSVVLGHFGPQELTDGMYAHLAWLHDLVKACLEDG